MKEFITDLLQKTNQAKYNLMQQQISINYSSGELSPTPEYVLQKMIVTNISNPNNASFYSLDQNNMNIHLNPGIYFLDIVPSFSGGAPQAFSLVLHAEDDDNETWVGTLKEIHQIVHSSNDGHTFFSGSVSTILIIENWNSNICLKHWEHSSTSARSTTYQAIMSITPLVLK